MRFRPEIAATILRVASGQRTPREIVAEIEAFAREHGVDETRIAASIGCFWGRYFKELEAQRDAA